MNCVEKANNFIVSRARLYKKSKKGGKGKLENIAYLAKDNF